MHGLQVPKIPTQSLQGAYWSRFRVIRFDSRSANQRAAPKFNTEIEKIRESSKIREIGEKITK